MLSPMPVAVPVAKVWEDVVSPFKFTMALPPTRVEVDIQEVPVPVEERIIPVVPEALLVSNKAPVSLMFPATESNCAGVVVPMPTRPVFVILMYSDCCPAPVPVRKIIVPGFEAAEPPARLISPP